MLPESSSKDSFEILDRTSHGHDNWVCHTKSSVIRHIIEEKLNITQLIELNRFKEETIETIEGPESNYDLIYIPWIIGKEIAEKALALYFTVATLDEVNEMAKKFKQDHGFGGFKLQGELQDMFGLTKTINDVNILHDKLCVFSELTYFEMVNSYGCVQRRVNSSLDIEEFKKIGSLTTKIRDDGKT